MVVSITEAKKRFSELLRAVEAGEEVVITRRGKAVARLEAPRRVRFGTLRGQIVLKPGWDAPITEEQFFSGDC
jgi:hypothetical protein